MPDDAVGWQFLLIHDQNTSFYVQTFIFWILAKNKCYRIIVSRSHAYNTAVACSMTPDNLAILLVICIYSLIVIRYKCGDLWYISRVLLYYYSHDNDKVYIWHVCFPCAHICAWVMCREAAVVWRHSTAYESATKTKATTGTYIWRQMFIYFVIKHINTL